MTEYLPEDYLQKHGVPTFDLGRKWMAVGAAAEGKANLMTASWGGFGTIWGRPAAFVFIRPERFTFGLVRKTEKVTLSFFGEEKRELLRTLGTVSGRDRDKCRAAGVTVEDGYVLPEDAETVLKGVKLYETALSEQGFVSDGVISRWYSDGGYHTMFVYGITGILAK